MIRLYKAIEHVPKTSKNAYQKLPKQFPQTSRTCPKQAPELQHTASHPESTTPHNWKISEGMILADFKKCVYLQKKS